MLAWKLDESITSKTSVFQVQLNISYTLGCPPLPVRVTTRIITFLVGNPYKPSFPLLLGGGQPKIYTKCIIYNLIYITIYIYIYLLVHVHLPISTNIVSTYLRVLQHPPSPLLPMIPMRINNGQNADSEGVNGGSGRFVHCWWVFWERFP